MNDFAADISRHIWETKYRYAARDWREQNIADTWRRVAHALAAVEKSDVQSVWEEFPLCKISSFFPAAGSMPEREPLVM